MILHSPATGGGNAAEDDGSPAVVLLSNKPLSDGTTVASSSSDSGNPAPGGYIDDPAIRAETNISVGSYVFVDGGSGSGSGSGARRARVEKDAGGGTWDLYYKEDGKEEFAVPSSRLTVTCSLYMVPAVTATWAMKGHALCVL